MSKKTKYRAILRDVGQVVIGELQSETEDLLVLNSPKIVHVAAQGQSINLQFIPLHLVSMQPPISLKVLFTEETAKEDLLFNFSKKELLISELDLKDDILEGYENSLKDSPIQTPSPQGLVGPTGEPLDETPKVQNLFG